MPLYQLKIDRIVHVGRRSYTVYTIFSWGDKADAIKCKELLAKAGVNPANSVSISFVEHTPDKPLTMEDENA